VGPGLRPAPARPTTGPTRGGQQKAGLVAAALATAIAGFFIAWASGMPLGRDPVTIRGQRALQALPQLVFALCTLAAGVGLPLLVHRRPRQARVLGPLALTWVGSASIVTWAAGCY
jgi:hypothetical protein